MDFEQIKSQFQSDTDGQTLDKAALEQLQIKYLGKKGILTLATEALKALPKEQKPQFGKMLNEVKQSVEARLAEIKAAVQAAEVDPKDDFDATLPGRHGWVGHNHPLTIVLNDIKQIFYEMGFTIEDGPEVELDYYNFETVNIPKDHPARDMQDTFFINENVVLRTHTTPVQARTMQRMKPPIRMICPGRVYRKDTPDATHLPFFNQIEGLVVDEHVTFADLKGTLAAFVHRLFGNDIGVRFRPSFFSFVEPGAEVDINCIFCRGKGCRTCKNSGWMEILGAGMVHPQLFDYAGYEKNKYTGYAFGMGLDRIVMPLYGINDLRLLIENDVRFLEQF
ncbi:phenylalanine--tRNA ligase subunit alpha [bacterium]|nr:phenylalanine--tRNA ligase subunit alpha [bacterium]NUN46488.1 phenylalanine--tRNA ligase subunit alpha [bacterium]